MKDDAKFVEDFNSSHDVVHLVAGFWQANGLEIKIPEVRLRPDASVRHKYSDDGDLKISVGGRPTRRDTIQVKGRSNIHFTGPRDYPYDTVFVDEEYKIDRSFSNLHSYCIVSKNRKKMCVIYWHTYKCWAKLEKMDKYQNRRCVFVACPVELCRWYDL